MSGFATYDPGKVVVNVGGIPIEGFADGTFVNVERSSDTFTKSTGADNRTTRIKQGDKSGTITITLSQSSPSNDVLSGIMLLDETTNDGVVPILVKDLLGTTLAVSAYSWIRKPPAAPFAKSISNREWIFDCADLNMYIGGNS